jgi:hypothetical protein
VRATFTDLQRPQHPEKLVFLGEFLQQPFAEGGNWWRWNWATWHKRTEKTGGKYISLRYRMNEEMLTIF